MSTTTADTTKVVTGLVRFSYLHIWEPVAVEEGQDKKYSLSIIIPKSDKQTLAKIRAAIETAKQQGKDSHFGGKITSKLKMPLRDGDEERPDDEAYADSYFLNASSKTKPGVVDKNLNAILDTEELYSGCYGRVSVNFYPFGKDKPSKGVACGLNNLQKMKDGEPLGGGRSKAEDDFAEVLEDDDDILG